MQGVEGFEGVGGDVGAAFVEGEFAPAAAEGGESAVAVLEVEEPAGGGVEVGFVLAAEVGVAVEDAGVGDDGS